MKWRRWIYAIPARLKAISRTRRTEQDLDDELGFHVAMQMRANAREGMSEREAYRRARVEIGGVEQTKERARDVRPLRWLRDVMQDVRYGLRGLRKTPRFTTAAVLTVVLGVGANATIFSVLNPLLFKPLPYPEPDRIVNVFRTSPQSDRWPHAMGNYLDHRDRNRVFEHLAAMMVRDASLADPDQPAERLLGIRASGNFFAVFGGSPLIGRAFTAADDVAGAPPVVVLSHRLWQRRFGGDRRIIGRSIRLDGVETTVINETMARTLFPDDDPIGKRIGFRGPNPNWREVVGVVGDVTFPSFAASVSVDTAFEVYQPIAQTVIGGANILLRTTRGADAVASDLKRVVATLDRDVPVYGLITARAAEERQTANLRLLANVLGGFALLGLVLAALGIFGVVSYSTAQRAGELGMRMALGARQSVVLWLVLKRGVALTMIGSLVGLGGGLGLSRVLSSMMPNLPGPELAVMIGVFAFMVTVALAAFAIPAWRASKTNPMLVLRHE